MRCLLHGAQAIEKKMQAQALLSEVAAANAEQIKRKELLKVCVCPVWVVG